MTSQLFFGPLRRRSQYTAKPNGAHYSYAYYRKHYQHEIAEDAHGRQRGGIEQLQQPVESFGGRMSHVVGAEPMVIGTASRFNAGDCELRLALSCCAFGSDR